MSLNIQKNLMQNHQHTAQKLLDYSNVLKQIFQDQWFYLWTLTPQNIWEIDRVNQQLSIADGLIQVHFITASTDSHQGISKLNEQPLIEFSSADPKINIQKIADFILNEVTFLIRDVQVQHSLFLQSKVQLFRQLLVEEVFKWVDGENRIEQYLYNLTVEDASQLDQIMIDAGYYTEAHLTAFAELGTAIPLNVELNFKHLSLVNSILGDKFLNVQQSIPFYDQLCLSAEQFIPTRLYRIIEIAFEDRFSFAQVIAHQNDLKLLLEHAMQQPQLLAFSQWVTRGYWQYKDIFSKKNFTQTQTPYWDERISTKFPLFYFNRTVNWLFKQEPMVIDWVAQHLDDIQVRIAVTAISFSDTSQIHPQVILETLKYFQSIVGRLFIIDCSHYAQTHHWFDYDATLDDSSQTYKKHSYVLRGEADQSIQPSNQVTLISDSILYNEEWLNLLYLIAKDDQRIAKQVFNRLYRVMQAYMLFVQKSLQNLPDDLIAYIHPDQQKNPKFNHLLHLHNIDMDDFRKRFKHPIMHFNRAESIFDSYVSDYLVDYFYTQKTLAKNVTWAGLFQQAARWHQQIHFEDTLAKLKQRIHIDQWRKIAPQEIMFTAHWKFVELNSLEQIIQESVHYKHCLALAYTDRIADGDYVAFHMTHLENEKLHLTLGCFFKYDQLQFDQLRLPNNEHADSAIEQDALEFIQKVNQYLIWDFKEPKVQ